MAHEEVAVQPVAIVFALADVPQGAGTKCPYGVGGCHIRASAVTLVDPPRRSLFYRLMIAKKKKDGKPNGKTRPCLVAPAGGSPWAGAQQREN